MVLLMVSWEVYEGIVNEGRVEGSVPLTVLDTAVDLLCGLLGTGLGMKVGGPNFAAIPNRQ